MNKNYLNGLCFFAKKRGYQNLSVIEVLEAYQAHLSELKIYRVPRVKVTSVEYRKRPLSWSQMNDILQKIICRKDAIAEMLKAFNIDADICIGGSLSLKYQMRAMRDRDFHDVDFIVTPASDTERGKLREFMHLMVKAGLASYSAAYYTDKCNSFVMGSMRLFGRECPINIIISKNICLPFRTNEVFNAPYEVVEAKKQYLRDAGSRKYYTRAKDIIDLYLMNV